MLYKGKLPVVFDTRENREGITEHSFFINGYAALPGCFAQSRLMKAVSHLDVLRVNLALSDQATTLSTSGCNSATTMSLLRALRAINRSST